MNQPVIFHTLHDNLLIAFGTGRIGLPFTCYHVALMEYILQYTSDVRFPELATLNVQKIVQCLQVNTSLKLFFSEFSIQTVTAN